MSITTTLTIEDTPINAVYQDVTGNTSGSGTGAKFDVTKTDGVYTVKLDAATGSSGSGYVAGDTVTILGTSLGGAAPDHNLIITVGTVGVGGKIATFGSVGAGRIGDGDIDVIFAAKGTAAKNEVFTLASESGDFDIAIDEDGLITVTHPDLDNISLTLKDIERLAFDDKTVAFDVDGHAGEIYALVAAAFGADDVTDELMGVYLEMADTGLSDVEIASMILSSKEYATDALGVGNETFIKQVWKNITGELPGLKVLEELTKGLDDKLYSKSELLEVASNLALWRDEDHLDFDTLKTTGIFYVPPGE